MPTASQSRQRTLLALLVAGTLFMESLDATVIAPAIPALAISFGTRAVAVNPGLSAYMMALGIFIPISGWVAERFGARRVFALAIILFTLASLLCAMATSLVQFVAMRALQGLGGALMVPVGRLIVLRETPKDDLIRAIAILTWPALIAPVLGPPLGGWIVQLGDWRWIFWLNLPLGAIALIAALRLLPAEQPRRDKRFDWSGFLLVGGAVACLLLVTEMLNGHAVNSGMTIVISCVGVGLGALAIRHLRRTADAVFDIKSLEMPTFRTAMVGGALFAMSVSAIPFLIPLLFQSSFGFAPIAAGTLLMAVFAGNLAMKPMTTRIMRRCGLRNVLIGNGIINAVLIALCASFSAQMPLVLTGLILFFGGMSRSMQFTAFSTIAFSDVTSESMPSASTLFSTVFQLSMGLGIALGALGWRIGETFQMQGGEATPPHHIAFLIVAFAAILSTVDCMGLNPNAGDHVTRRSVELKPDREGSPT